MLPIKLNSSKGTVSGSMKDGDFLSFEFVIFSSKMRTDGGYVVPEKEECLIRGMLRDRLMRRDWFMLLDRLMLREAAHAS